jgi:hypothetical protein
MSIIMNCYLSLSLSPDKMRGKQQGITNTVALPIDKMMYINLLCPHSEHEKNPFQSKTV